MLSGSLSQGWPLEHQMLNVGWIRVRSSSVPPIIEQISGYLASVIDAADPQIGQKCR